MRENELKRAVSSIKMNDIQKERIMKNIKKEVVGRTHNIGGWKRFISVAAVIALIIGSFAVGSVVIAKKQEVIKIDNFGISIILPDSWAGKYGYEIDGNTLAVYQIATHDNKASDWYGQGYLFWIDCLDEVYPMNYVYPEPGFTIATTASNTYRLRRASDIQYDFKNKSASKEYLEMSNTIGEIQIVLIDWMKNNSTNLFN